MPLPNPKANKYLAPMKYALAFLLGCFYHFAPAQDVAYAQKQVKKLSSKTFWGRGYTKKGMQKTADYLAQQLRDLGLSPMSDEGFKQSFAYPINTFPGKMKLSINGKRLRPGRDFIINPTSRSCTANGRLHQVDSNNFINSQHQFLATMQNKLTWPATADTIAHTHVLIKKSAFADTCLLSFKVDVEKKFVPDFTAHNVCGIIKGTAQPDSIIILTAHYDHLGGMGAKTYFAGANDNASGTAFLLNLARHFAKHPQRYSIGFIFFAGEEAGLKGSKFFTEHPLVPLKNIRLLFNFDMVGTGQNGVTVVNATTFTKEFAQLMAVNQKYSQLKVTQRGKARNSDHYYFSEKGVPSFFLYTLGGNPAYHDVNDRPKNISFTAYIQLFNLVTNYCAILSGSI